MAHEAGARDGDAKRTILQFIQFNIVGVLNTLVDFVVFQILNLLLGWTYVAQVISYSCGVVNSYIWNSSWTFRAERTRSPREMIAFLAVNLVSLCVSLGVLWFSREVLGVTDAWVATWLPDFLAKFVNGNTVAKLIATACAIVVNYLGNKRFVFRKGSDQKEG